MKVIKITDSFEMDYGAPSPVVLSNDTKLFVSFYADSDEDNVLVQRNSAYDKGIITVTFHGSVKYLFGIPNNEMLYNHPYARLGVKSSSFYEVKESDWINNEKKIAKKHNLYDSKIWDSYKHYILTFHDNMFECIAKGYNVEINDLSMLEVTFRLVNQINKSFY